MWDVIVRFITGFIISISGIWIVKNVSGTKDFSFNVKTFIWTVLLSIPSIILYGTEYHIIISIITWLIAIIAIRRIFTFSWFESIMYSLVPLLLIVLIKIFIFATFCSWLSLDGLKNSNIPKMLTTIIFISWAIFIDKANCIKKKAYKFSNYVGSENLLKVQIFIIISMLLVCVFIYVIGENYSLNEKFIIGITMIIINIILNYLYIKEKNQHDSLSRQYDTLLAYVSEFSDWMETEQLKNHEHNNTLSKLRIKVKNNPEALEMIDEQLTIKFEIDKNWSESLKYIPNGSLKGLFFYKIIQANKYKVNLVVDISKTVSKAFQRIDAKLEKNMCYLFGIYTDNALEATKLSDKKNIGIEVYVREEVLHIIISNTFSIIPQLNQLAKKGYTTKGEGHGKGLYLAQKIVKTQKEFQEEHQVCNNYYIEHLKINLLSKKAIN